MGVLLDELLEFEIIDLTTAIFVKHLGKCQRVKVQGLEERDYVTFSC
jgi:hypothetical protein